MPSVDTPLLTVDNGAAMGPGRNEESVIPAARLAMTQLTRRTSAWQQAGGSTEVGGHRIFVRERLGAGDGPSLLLLHGYPSSSFDWRHAFEMLPGRHLIVFDFLGYG